MPIRYAFLGSRGAWFLHADLVPLVVCVAANDNLDGTLSNKIVDLDETSSATSSSDVSVGGLIKKYFQSFTDASNHSSHTVKSGAVQRSRAKGKQKYRNLRRKSKLAVSPDFTVKTPPRLLNALSSPKKSKVGNRIVMASYSLGISPCQETVSSLRQSKSGRFKALRSNSSPIRCPVFEMSGDSDEWLKQMLFISMPKELLPAFILHVWRQNFRQGFAEDNKLHPLALMSSILALLSWMDPSSLERSFGPQRATWLVHHI